MKFVQITKYQYNRIHFNFVVLDEYGNGHTSIGNYMSVNPTENEVILIEGLI